MKKVLVVDDMDSWRRFHKNNIEEIFIEDGVNVDVANYARVALDKIYENSSEPYDIILTDLQMEEDFEPKYAGEWLVEQIQTLSAYKNTRIIISSGTASIKYIAENLGVDYIPKRVACTDIEEYERVIIGRA